MHKTKYMWKTEIEYCKFKTLRFLYQMKLILTRRDVKRKSLKSKLMIFDEEHIFSNSNRDNGIFPKEIYYKPTDIILYDLIPKQNIPKVLKGINKLFKQHMSHRFLPAACSPDKIAKMVDDINNTLNTDDAWFKTGVFDFADDSKLDKYIHYFEIRIRNFSSSYIAIEMTINLSQSFQKEMNDFIHNEFKLQKTCLRPFWKQNSKKSGAKIGFGVGFTSDKQQAKNVVLYEQLQYIKKLFLREIKKYLPLLQYSSGKNIYGINVFETNIDVEKQKTVPTTYLSGVGLEECHGFFLSKAERMYTKTSFRHSSKPAHTDFIYVFNPEKIDDFSGFASPQDVAMFQLTNEYLDEMYSLLIIRNLGRNYADDISNFRNLENKLKNNRKSHKKLLKLKYEIEREYYTFAKIDREVSVPSELEKVKNYLESNDYVKRSVVFPFYEHRAYQNLIKSSQYIWELVKQNYRELLIDINDKINVSSSLNSYYDARKNYRISWIQVIIASITFILLIFPDKSLILAELLKKLASLIMGYLTKVLETMTGLFQ